MVRYWMFGETQKAKVTTAKDGHYIMWIKGEKYPFPGFPRGTLLFSSLSKLKHEIKNKIFNDAWAHLESGKTDKETATYIKGEAMDYVLSLHGLLKHKILPIKRMVLPIQELWRGWAKVEEKAPKESREKIRKLKEIMCFILQEDDGYRFRVQWLAGVFNPSSWWRRAIRLFTRKTVLEEFEWGLKMMEHAEVTGDMKERIRLLRRILVVFLTDENVRTHFNNLCQEVNWNKLKLSKADRYYFRAKYFRCDFDKGFEY